MSNETETIRREIPAVKQKLGIQGGTGTPIEWLPLKILRNNKRFAVFDGHTVTWTKNQHQIKINYVNCHTGKHAGIKCNCRLQQEIYENILNEGGKK